MKEISAGVIAGVVAGVLWAPLYLLGLTYQLALPMVLANIYTGHPEYVQIVWLSIVGGFVIVGALVGLLVGVIFLKIRNRLPGRSVFVKAVVLAVTFWLPAAFVSIVEGSFLSHLYSAVFNLLADLVAAAVFSFLLRRLSPAPPQVRNV